MSSSSSKPYLVRAIFEWLVDNELTPHLLITTELEGLLLPEDLYAQKQLVLNISPAACRNLSIKNDGVSFSARFSGVARDIYLPFTAVLAIFAREDNSLGMGFGQEPYIEKEETEQATSSAITSKSATEKKAQLEKKPTGHLKLIK